MSGVCVCVVPFDVTYKNPAHIPVFHLLAVKYMNHTVNHTASSPSFPPHHCLLFFFFKKFKWREIFLR